MCDFLFSRAAGIQTDPAHPGCRKILLRPTVGGTLTHAEAVLERPCGTIRSGWKKEATYVHCHFEIPVNTFAEITLPDGRTYQVGNGVCDFSCSLTSGFHWDT